MSSSPSEIPRCQTMEPTSVSGRYQRSTTSSIPTKACFSLWKKSRPTIFRCRICSRRFYRSLFRQRYSHRCWMSLIGQFESCSIRLSRMEVMRRYGAEKGRHWYRSSSWGYFRDIRWWSTRLNKVSFEEFELLFCRVHQIKFIKIDDDSAQQQLRNHQQRDQNIDSNCWIERCRYI